MIKSPENREEEFSLSQEIKDKKEILGKDKFITVDLGLSDIEKDILEKIKVEKELS